MASLLDQAIEMGKSVQLGEQLLSSLKGQIEQAETTLAERVKECSRLERESSQRISNEQTQWEQTKRQQETQVHQREQVVEARETAMKEFPVQHDALAKREGAVAKREADVTVQWQQAKQAELDWQERNKELDAKAAAINQLAS